MTTTERDEAGRRMLKRAFAAHAGLGVVATVITFFGYGRFAAQSVFLGAGFAAAHLFTVARSVHASFGGEKNAFAPFFIVFRSLRFLSVLVASALVLVAGWAGPVGFLFGYALLVPAIASAVLPRSGDET